MGACFHTQGVTCDNCRPLGDMRGPPPSSHSVFTFDTAEEAHKRRRERIAVAAMNGMLNIEPIHGRITERTIASTAVRMADALIAELDKEEP